MEQYPAEFFQTNEEKETGQEAVDLARGNTYYPEVGEPIKFETTFHPTTVEEWIIILTGWRDTMGMESMDRSEEDDVQEAEHQVEVTETILRRMGWSE